MLTSFLKNINYREKLQQIGRQRGMPAEAGERLKNNAPSFARWRWGTLSKVSQYLCALEPVLLQCWGPETFKLKDSHVSKTLHETMADPDFWEKCKVLARWSKELDSVRTWGQGCPCHEKECIQASKQHKVFACPENRKSCRGPELEEKLQDLWARWASNASEAFSSGEGDASLNKEMGTVWRATIAEAQIRFGWVSRLPWLIWRCREQDQAHPCTLR